jgi:predicted AAA+ superfamily ATPase
MKLIERKEYLDRLIALKEKQVIKIITGIRRCGKSTLFEMYQEYLLQQKVTKSQIIAINLEDFDFFELRDPRKLYDYIITRLIQDQISYVFLDEVQHVQEFPDVVNSLFIKKNIDLYLTGSNAYMLSSEIATLISGRYIEIAMLPLSFREYVSSKGNINELDQKYVEYLQHSSFPYALELKDDPMALHDYLSGIYNTVVLKDVVARNKISDVMMLESVIRFIFDNIGNLLSTKKIADTMTSNGRKIDVKTVEKYLASLQASYILYQAKRYNIKGKQFLKTLEKYYVVDIGLRTLLLGSRAYDVGHILENIVYLELIRRGNHVYVGKFDDLEVDFVSVNPKGVTYYQVAATVRSNETLQRELAPLKKINDQYPKQILTLDNDPDADYEGILRTNALKWLIGNLS